MGVSYRYNPAARLASNFNSGPCDAGKAFLETAMSIPIIIIIIII